MNNKNNPQVYKSIAALSPLMTQYSVDEVYFNITGKSVV